MKILKQIIYDLQKNKKVDIYVEPRGIPLVEIDSNDILEEEFGGMVKRYPSRASEELTYDVSEL